MEYYIYITNDCNLNCSYCSVISSSNTLPEKPIYKLEDLKNFINRIQKNYPNTPAVIYFFGGEPTLDFNYINSIIEIFEITDNYEVQFVLHTNGILIKNIPQSILDKLTVIFLSLNYEKIYDKGKISDYFANICRNIAFIKKKKNIPFIGRLTISENTSIYTECSIMGSIFDAVYWQLDNQKELKNIIEYKEQYIKEIALLFDYWLTFFREGFILRYVPFMNITQKLIKEVSVPEHFYCGYGDDIIYIQTDGSCYACCDDVESKSHFIGDIYKGIVFENMDLSNTACYNCEYIKLCGGRCGRMHKDFSKDRIRHYCDMNQFTFQLFQNNIEEILGLIDKYPETVKIINSPLLNYTELIP